METFGSVQELMESQGKQESAVPRDFKILNVATTKSVESLPEGDYTFHPLPDRKNGNFNIVGVHVNAPPEQTDSTFFVAEEPAISGHLKKAVFWNERDAENAAEAWSVKCRIEKSKQHENNS